MDQFLVASMGLCALGALFNLALIKRRGVNALILSLSFVVLGFTLQLYRMGGLTALSGTGFAAVIVLLIADFVLRAQNPRPRK